MSTDFRVLRGCTSTGSEEGGLLVIRSGGKLSTGPVCVKYVFKLCVSGFWEIRKSLNTNTKMALSLP